MDSHTQVTLAFNSFHYRRLYYVLSQPEITTSLTLKCQLFRICIGTFAPPSRHHHRRGFFARVATYVSVTHLPALPNLRIQTSATFPNSTSRKSDFPRTREKLSSSNLSNCHCWFILFQTI